MQLIKIDEFFSFLSNKGEKLKTILDKLKLQNFVTIDSDKLDLHIALVKEHPTWFVWSQIKSVEIQEAYHAVNFIKNLNFSESVGLKQTVIKSEPVNGTGSHLSNLMQQLGPPIWKDLHTFAKSWDGNIDTQTEFLKKVTNRIPCGECKQFWVKNKIQNPAPTDNKENFFAWTVDTHNKVNIKLNKPTISLEEAIALYSES
jgi:hypothetical protein